MRLRLTEYGQPVPWMGTDADLERLRGEALRWKGVLGLADSPIAIEYLGGHRHTVRAEGITGFLQVGQTAVEIRPKFLVGGDEADWRRALWVILAAVEEHPAVGELTPATRTDAESLPDLLGWLLVESLQQGHALGFPRGYVEHGSSVDVLRGRLDVNRIAEMLITPYSLPCVYDVYDEDVAVNRLFRWAALMLSNMARSPYLSRRLGDAAAIIGHTADTPPGIIEAEHLSLPATYRHLAPALQVARMLLRRESLLHVWGQEQAASFLWNSADIFERLVKHLLRQLCRRAGGLRLDDRGQTLAMPMPAGVETPAAILTYPDARLHAGGRTRLVLDAKYKTLGAGGRPSNEDIYQVMAAGRLNACDEVYLLYPSPSGERRPPLRWSLLGAGRPRRVTALFIDLLEMGRPAGEQRLGQTLADDLGTSLHAMLDESTSTGARAYQGAVAVSAHRTSTPTACPST